MCFLYKNIIFGSTLFEVIFIELAIQNWVVGYSKSPGEGGRAFGMR